MSLRAQAIAEGFRYVALRGSRVVGFASTKKEAEKLGKPERLPSIPAKYLRGLTGRARVKRAQEILRERRRGTYKPLPSDKGAKTKRSSWSVKFQRKYKERPDNMADVARLTGIPKSILQKVYNKGLAAWSTGGHRPGASQHAWAMARVQSFVLGGPTAKGPDKKLAQQAGLVRNPLFPDPPTETTGAKKHRAGASHARTIKLWMGAPSIKSLYHGVHVSPNLSAASAYALGRLRVQEFPAEVIDAPVLIGIGKTCVAEDLGDMDMLTTAHDLWEQSAKLAEELVENDGEVDWEDIEIADYAADEYFSELDYLGFRQVLGTLANRPEQADYADALTKMAVYRIRHKLLVLDRTDMDDLMFPTSPQKQAEAKLRKYAISLSEQIVAQVRLPCLVKWEDVVYVGVLPPIAPGTSEKPLKDGSGYQESFPYNKDYQEDLDDVDRATLDRMVEDALVDVYGDRSKVKYWHGTSSTFAASAFPKHLNKAVLDEASFEPEVWEDDELEENPLETDSVLAYHCGRDIGRGSFSLRFLRTGEGWRGQMPLGDGIYFATNPRIALRYCRNIPKPYMYRVRITKENMRRGSWSPDAIKRQNIWSAFTTLGDGSHEIAVFNPKAITVLKKVKMASGLAENPTESLTQFFDRIGSLNLSLCLMRWAKGYKTRKVLTGPVPQAQLGKSERVQVCLIEGKFRKDVPPDFGKLVGFVSLSKPPHPCNSALIVNSSALVSKYQGQGLGTFLYMCAMYAFGPIISDRMSVSTRALAMYSRLAQRYGKFAPASLDNVYDPQTVPENDDCWLFEGGLYADEEEEVLNNSYRMRLPVKKEMQPVFDKMAKRFRSRVLNPAVKTLTGPAQGTTDSLLQSYWNDSSDLFSEEY